MAARERARARAAESAGRTHDDLIAWLATLDPSGLLRALKAGD
jgi:hypothetical protein